MVSSVPIFNGIEPSHLLFLRDRELDAFLDGRSILSLIQIQMHGETDS